MNVTSRYRCNVCDDERWFEICDDSTDALIGWHKCEACPPAFALNDPWFYAWGGVWKRTPAELAADCPF